MYLKLKYFMNLDKNSNSTIVLNSALTAINSKFIIFESIIQVEEFKDEMNSCVKCKDPVV